MNQEQNNLDQNNFNAQGNNEMPNNGKAPIKIKLGSIIGIVVAVAIIVIVGVVLFSKINNKNSSNENTVLNGSSNHGNSSVDLTIDESIPKSITGNLVGEARYAEDITYSYRYVLPNWNRYTFLKEYKPASIYDADYDPNKIYVVDYDKEGNQDRHSDSTTAYTNDFKLYIDYSVDRYSSAVWPNIKERATDNLVYTDAGSPTLYGNENGYWYAYMDKGYNLNTDENDLDILHVNIWKEMDRIKDAHNLGENVFKDECHALSIDVQAWYANETGKIRLNYLLNDLKEILEEAYDLDLSQLTIDMIKK